MKTGSVCPEMSKDPKTMRKSTIWDRDEAEGVRQIRNLRRLPRLNPHPVSSEQLSIMSLMYATASVVLGVAAAFAGVALMRSILAQIWQRTSHARLEGNGTYVH